MPALEPAAAEGRRRLDPRPRPRQGGGKRFTMKAVFAAVCCLASVLNAVEGNLFSPQDVPGPPEEVLVTHENDTALRFQLFSPENAKAEGVNGAPVLGYKVEVARRVDEVHSFTVASTGPVLAGTYKMAFTNAFGADTTACVAWNASALEFELALEELLNVDDVLVTRSGDGVVKNGYTYAITFNGDYLVRGPQPTVLEGSQIGCTATQPANRVMSFVGERVTAGVASFYPEVWEIVTQESSGSTGLSGTFDLSIGFEGDWVDSLVTADIAPGSKTAKTSVSMVGKINRGDAVKIGDEEFVVHATAPFTDSQLPLDSYHVHGTTGAIVYLLDTAMGDVGVTMQSAAVQTNSDFTNLVSMGEFVKIGAWEFQVAAVPTSTSLQLDRPWPGVTTRHITAHKKKKATVDASVDAADMATALNALPGMGSVAVSRVGPTRENGYRWFVTFLSLGGRSNCPTSPCLAADKITGRQNRLRDSYGRQCATCTVTAAIIMDETKTTILRGVTGDYTSDSIIVSRETRGGVYEVQSIAVMAAQDDLSGSFAVNFQTTFQEYPGAVIFHDDTAIDVQTKLQNLPAVGRVNVTQSSNAYFGTTWTVTFLSNIGDMPLFIVDYSSLTGTDPEVKVTEVMKGSPIDFEVVIDGLTPSQEFYSRAFARNANGYGTSTGLIQWEGKGVQPLVSKAATYPAPPTVVSTLPLSETQIQIGFAAPDTRGESIKRYVVEYAAESSFGVPAIQKLFAFNSREDDISGTFQLEYAGIASAKLPIDVTAQALKDALNRLPSMRRTTVSRALCIISGEAGNAVVSFSANTNILTTAAPLTDIQRSLLTAGTVIDVNGHRFVVQTQPADGSSSILVQRDHGVANFNAQSYALVKTDASGAEKGPFGYEWTIVFADDAEHKLSSLFPSLRLSSSLWSVESGSALSKVGISDIVSATPPDHFGSFVVSNDPTSCDTYVVGAPSDVQVIQLFASTTITDGSFMLQLGDDETSCIRVGTAATKSDMKTELEALAYVERATVEEQRNFKVMLLAGSSQSKVSSFNSVSLEVAVVSTGTSSGLTADEAAALPAGAIFRASRNPYDSSRDSCEFKVGVDAAAGDAVIKVLNTASCVSFTDTRTLQVLDFSDYKIRLWGQHPSGEWPTLKIVPDAFGDGTRCAPVWAPVTTNPVYGTVHTIRYEGVCAMGQHGTQTILAEAASTIGGTFTLSYRGQETPALAFQGTTAAVMRDAIDSITSTGSVNVSLSQYGTYGRAWHITFMSGTEQEDVIFIKHSRLTGLNVVISVYDTVQVITDADQDDLRGSFQIAFNGETTERIAVAATHKKVTQELQKLQSVDSVLAVGEATNGDIGVYSLELTAQATHNSAILTQVKLEGRVIDPTLHLAVREKVSIGGDAFWIQSLTLVDITLSSQYTGTSGRIDVFAGLITKQTKAIPGHIAISRQMQVITATPTLYTIEFPEGHGFAIGDSFFLGGNKYTIQAVAVNAVTTDRAYTGVPISSAVPQTFVFDNRLRTTRDWTNLVAVGDYLWIRSNSVDMARYTVEDVQQRYIEVSGLFTTDIIGGIAYRASHGRQWNLIFRSYQGSLKSVNVIPYNDFRGTNARIGSRGSASITPRTLSVGNPKSTQTLLLEAQSTADIGAAVYKLTFNGDQTIALPWVATAIDIQAALEDLDSVDGVSVDSKVYGNGFVHAVSFWGVYTMRKLPLLEAIVTGATTPGNVVIRVAGNGAVATSKRDNLILHDDFVFRIFALNQGGISSPSPVFTAQPWSVSVVPTPPTSVVLGEFHGSTWLSVNYRPPLYSGGSEVTMYRLEWDSSPSFDSTSRDYGVATIQKRYEVQHVTTSFRSAIGASGSFTLSWGGRMTTSLPFDCSADVMMDALAIITDTANIAIEPVKVRRVQASWGYTWRITFQHTPGNLAALVANGEQLAGDFPRVSVEEIVDGFSDLAIGDFTREVQDVYTDSKTKLSGSFKLEFEGKVTAAISVSASALEMQAALQAITSLFSIKVSKLWRNEAMNNAIWSVTFAYLQGEELVGAGNVFIMQVSDSTQLSGTAAAVNVASKVSGSDPFRHFITDLRPGVQYYMHAMAYNEDGFGSATSPMSTATTCGQPDPPGSVVADVKDGKTLSVRWSASAFNGGCPVSKYKVEWFQNPGTFEEQTITTSAGKGLPEIQRLVNFADSPSLSGYFRLSFQGEMTENIAWNAQATGPGSVKERLERLSSVGTVDVSLQASARVVNGLLVTAAATSTIVRDASSAVTLDQTGLRAGDTVWIAGMERRIVAIGAASFTVNTAVSVGVPVPVFQKANGFSWAITFLSGHVGAQPLLKVSTSDSWGGDNPGIYVESVQKGLQPISGTFRLSFASGGMSDTTPPLTHNTSAIVLKTALESLVTVGKVNVTRSQNGFGYNWAVTFLTEFANDMSLLAVDGTELHGPSVRVSVARTRDGVQPTLYCESNGVIGTPAEVGAQGTLQYDITGLATGVKYGVRVRGYNQEGYGDAQYLSPAYQVPRTTPSPPTNIKLVVLSSRMIKVRWETPASDGGSAIISYLVQWDTTSAFSSAASPNYDLQRTLRVESGASGPFFVNIPVLTRTSYFVRVYAVNDQGSSDAARPSPLSVVPFDQTPGKVESATAMVLSSYAILVKWDASSVEKAYFGGDGGLSITQYMVEWDSSSAFDSPAAFGLVRGSERSYIIGGDDPLTGVRSDMLTPETMYYVRITAFNAKGAGVPSPTTPASVLVTNQPPTAPQDLSLSILSSTSVKADWKNPQFDGGSSLKSYHLEWDEQDDFASGESDTAVIPIVREMQSVIVRSDVVNEEQFIEATVEVTNEEQMVRTLFTGVDEVQVVETTNAQVVDEIVAITTSAEDINEIQELRLDADDINEIQAVRTTTPEVLEVQSIEVGASRINEVQTITLAFPGVTDPAVIAGSFTLSFDSRVCTYCSLTKTFERSAELVTSLQNSDPIVGATKMKTELDALSNIDSVTVTRTDTSDTTGLTYVYSIEFSGDAVAGDVLALKIESSLTTTINGVTSTVANIPTSAIESTKGNEVAFAAGSVFSITYTCESYSGPAESTGVSAECTPSTTDRLCTSCVTDFNAATRTFTVNTDVRAQLPLLTGYKLMAGACSFEAATVGASSIIVTSGDVGTLCSSFSNQAFALFKAKQFVASIPLKSSATQPLVGSSVEALLNAVINSVTVTDTTKITSTFVGAVYAVTFRQRSGTLPLLQCGATSIGITNSGGTSSCSVSRTQIGSSIAGTFTLALTLESTPSAAAIATAAIPWDASEAQMKSALELVASGGEQVFGSVTIKRSVYSETGDKWSGGFTWQIEFTSRRGNVPRMTADTTNLVNADTLATIPSAVVEDYANPLNPSAGSRDGNQIGGTMTFAFKGVRSPVVYTLNDASIAPATLSTSSFTDSYLEQFLITNLGIPSIKVTRSAATQARGFTWTIEFTDQTTGGDVELLQLPITALTGTNVRAVVVEKRKGNQLGGTFQLTFNGDSTGPILFSADKAAVQAQLNSLSSIKPSSVLVDRVGPRDTANVQVKSYQWLITFYSSVWADPTSDHSSGIAGNWKGARAKWDDVWPDTGYSKAWGRHVGPMDANGFVFDCVKDGLTTTANDNTQTCLVTIVRPGVGPINGAFTLTLDTSGLAPRMSVARSVTSTAIAHNAWATRAESGASGTSVEEILEGMANVGDVSVSRSAVNPLTGGYSWSITFLRDVYETCEEVEYSSTGARLCNSPGDVPEMTASGAALTGQGPAAAVRTVQNGQILRGDFTVFNILNDPGWVGQFFLLPDCDVAASALTCKNIQRMTIDVTNSAAGLGSFLQPNDRFSLDGYPACVFTTTTVTASTVTVATTDCITMNPVGLASMGMNVLLSWNAAADAVARALEGSYIGRQVSVTRTVQGKYGEMSWLVHFISNPGSTPPGAGNIPDIRATFSPAATTTATVGVSVTEVTAGSRGLSGSFLVDFHSAIGPRQVAFDEDPERLERKLNEMNTIGRVTVDRFKYPSSATGCSDSTCSGGWDDQPVDSAGTRGGYRWRIRFMKVTGEYGGLTFPSGSGNVGPLSVTLSTLQGNQRSVDVITNKAGSNPITGSFVLNTSSKATPALQYSSSADTIKQGIESMQLYGDVLVTQSYLVTQQIPDAVAMVAKDGVSAAITGVSDISQFIAPGDVFRIGYAGTNNLVGSNGDWPFTKDVATSRVIVSSLSPVVKAVDFTSTELLYPGMTLRIDGLVYTVKHSGQEIQQVTVAVPTASWTAAQTADIFNLRLKHNGVALQTTCLSFNADGSDVKSELDAAIPGADVKVVRKGPITDTNGDKGYVYTVYFRGTGVAGDVGTLEFSTAGCGGTITGNPTVTGSTSVVKHGGEIGQQTLTLATDSGSVIDTAGFFKLKLGGRTSDCLRWGATESDVESQLENKLATGDVIVTRQGSGESITEIQRLRMTSSSEVTSGTTGLFQLMLTVDSETMTTSCLSYGVSAEDLQTALNGLGNFGATGSHINVTRTGDGTSSWGFGYEYSVNFRGPVSGGFSRVLANVQPMAVINVGTSPCAPVVGGNPALIIETVREGTPGYRYDIFFLDYPSAITPLITMLDERNSLCVKNWVHDGGSVRQAKVESVAIGGSAEIQVLTIRNIGAQAPAPTFALTFSGQTSPCLAVSSEASDIQDALNGLLTIGAGGVWVSRDTQPVIAPGGFIYKITFIGDTVTGNVPELVLDYTVCVAPTGASEIIVETAVDGGQPPSAFALTEHYDGEAPGTHVGYAVSQLFSVMQEQFEIQEILIVNSANDITATGTYMLAYGATPSATIPWDASEVVMEAKLTALLKLSGLAVTAGGIIVTRRVDAAAAPNGYLYTVYFSGNEVAGNLQQLVPVASGYSVSFGTAYVSVSTKRDGVDGALTLQKQLLPLASAASSTVAATYMADDDALSVFKVNGFFWTIKFASTIGDVPALGTNTDGLVGNLAVVDNFVRGSASNSYVLTNLLPGITYYAHVAASTDIGKGPYSIPAAMIVPSSSASSVQNIAAGYALYTPEVQQVRLAATHITEVQEIATSAASIPEVQTLRTYAAPDTCFSSSCIEGKFAFRVPTIQTITISSLAKITDGEFTVRFRRFVQDATTPGTFGIFGGAGAVVTTTKLKYDATASDLKMALIGLDALEPDDIIVTRDGDGSADYDYGYIYSITFVGNDVAGETEKMEVYTLGNGCPTCTAFDAGGVDSSVTVDMNTEIAMGTDTAVQEVVVSASKPLVAGSYQLSFLHLDDTKTSACIPFDAPARSPSGTDPRAMETILTAMDNIDKVFVTRTVDAGRAPNGFVYRIFFYGNGVYGKVNKMTAIPTLAPQVTPCTPFQTLENNVLTATGVNGDVQVTVVDGGGFEADNTFVDAATATAAKLASDLDQLPVFGNVLVTQSLADEQGGYIWTVAFKDSEGNLPPFICAVDDDFAMNTGSGCETETLTDGNTLSGSFVVEASAPIAFDASASDVKAALEAMEWVGSVQVMRSGPSAQLGYVWTITFLEYVGDVPALLITSSLVGTGSTVTVTEIRKGNAIGGSFTLSYLNSVTTPILWNAPAKASDSGGDGSSLQEKLEALSVVGAIGVTRSTADHEGGYIWVVTFLDSTVNPGDLPLLQANSSALSGVGVVAFTREVSKGSNAVGDQLWLSFDPPDTDNGSPITKYRVRWDTSSTFAASPGESFLSDPALLYQTQRITTSAPSLAWSAIMPPVVAEIQQLVIANIATAGNTFTLSFRGQTTNALTVSTSTASDMQAALSLLTSVGGVSVSPVAPGGTTILAPNSAFLITFTQAQGLLPTLEASSTLVTVTRQQVGSTNFLKKVVVFTCTSAALGVDAIEFSSGAAPISLLAGAVLATVEEQLVALFGTEPGGITVTTTSGTQTTLCAATTPAEITITFHQVFGDAVFTITPAATSAATIARVDSKCIDGVYNPRPNAKMSGTFQIGYNDDYTRALNAESTADQIRFALEDLSTIDTIGVTREPSYQPLPGLVDAVNGQIYVTCSIGQVCSFATGAYGLPGDLIRIGGDWYTVRVDDTSPTLHASRLYLGDLNGHETGYRGSSQSGVRVYEWAKGYVWTVTLLRLPDSSALTYLRAKVPRLYPPDASVRITGSSCSKCYYLPTGTSYKLTMGQLYYIQVDAYNANGKGATTTPLASATPSQVSNAPSNVDLAVVSGTQLEVFFSPPALATTNVSPNFNNDISAYIVQWDVVSVFKHGMPICSNCAVALSDANVLSTSVGSLVSSRMTVGTRFTIADGSCVLEVAQPVVGLTVTVTPGHGCARFSGKAYSIYYYTFAPAVISGSLLAGSPPYRYLITGLTTAATYYVRVAAVNSVPVQKIALDGNPPDNRKWSYPLSAATKDKVPDRPISVALVSFSGTALQVHIQPPTRDGQGLDGAAITHYWIDVDTVSTFDSATKQAPLEVAASSIPALIASSVSTRIYTLAGLTNGVRYFVQVKAKSSIGYSPATLAPSPLAPTRSPDAPVNVKVSTVTTSSVPIQKATVSWQRPVSSGGLPITSYKVEWWRGGASRPEVQMIELKWTSAPTEAKFSLSFSGQQTGDLTHNVAPENLRSALMNIMVGGHQAVGHIQVSRSTIGSNLGYQWIVTFASSVVNPGDQPMIGFHLGTVTGGVGVTGSVSEVTSGVAIPPVVDFPGSREVQVLVVSALTAVGGFFRFSFKGSAWSSYIPVTATAEVLEQCLEQLPTLGQVSVSILPTAGLAMPTGRAWAITFVSVVGNAPALTVDSSKVTPATVFVGVKDGDNAVDSVGVLCYPGDDPLLCPGRTWSGYQGEVAPTATIGERAVEYAFYETIDANAFTYTITGLTSGQTYFVSVTAKNALGLGPRARSSPSSIAPPVQVPQPPINVAVDVNFGVATQLKASWNSPTSDGGADVWMYRIEYDPSPLFKNRGMQDVWCPTSPTLAVWRIRTSRSVAGNPIASGFFNLVLTRQNTVLTSEPIPWNAVATSEEEAGGDPTTSDVFCTPCVGCSDVCDSQATFSPRRRELSGSMQSKLEYFSTLSNGVKVSRTATADTDGGYTWTITFQDTGDDFNLQAAATNYLSCAAGTTPSLTTCGGASYTITTTKLTTGVNNPICSGVGQIIPSIGALNKGQLYYVRVFAYNKVGFSLPALAASPQKPMVVPGAPTGVTLQVASVSELVVLFSPPDDNGGDTIVAYQVQWALDGGFSSGTGTQLVTLLSGGAPYSTVVGGLIKGTPYYVRVRAKNSQGFGTYQPSSPTFLNPHTTPAAPTKVTLGVTSSSMLTVQWNVPDDDGGDALTGFVVQWDVSASFDSLSVDATTARITDVTQRSYTITLLTSGTSYYVRVLAVNRAGSGTPQTTTPTSLVPANTRPGKPHTLTAEAGAAGTLKISWQLPRVPAHLMPCAGSLLIPQSCPVFGGVDVVFGGSAFESYLVQWARSSDFSGYDWRSVVTTSTLVTGLDSGTRYYVRVMAVNGEGLKSDFCARANSNDYLCPDGLVLLDGTIVTGDFVSVVVL